MSYWVLCSKALTSHRPTTLWRDIPARIASHISQMASVQPAGKHRLFSTTLPPSGTTVYQLPGPWYILAPLPCWCKAEMVDVLTRGRSKLELPRGHPRKRPHLRA